MKGAPIISLRRAAVRLNDMMGAPLVVPRGIEPLLQE